MSIDGFAFEGRDMTAADVRKAMPAYKRTALGKFQSALESGVQSIPDMASYIERVNAQALRESNLVGKRAMGGHVLNYRRRK